MPKKEITDILRQQGLCNDCWQPSTTFRCSGCKQRACDRYRKLYAERKARGVCVDCGESPVVADTVKCQKHIDRDRAKDKKKRNRLKDEVFTAYGGYRCNCCGETGKSFLAIDHINNDGAKHRKEIGHKSGSTGFYTWLRKNKFPEGFQVLCFNCNHSKAINGGICEHRLCLNEV